MSPPETSFFGHESARQNSEDVQVETAAEINQ